MILARCRLTCGAAAWWIAGNDARKAQASEIQAELVIIIFANELGVHLGYAVNSARPLYLQENESKRENESKSPLLNKLKREQSFRHSL